MKNNKVKTNSQLSIVVPMHNEESAMPLFFAAIIPLLKTLVDSFEIICIDDGSTDRTIEIVEEWQSNNPQIRLIALSRCFGKEAAMTAGLHFAYGDCVVPIDADLQDPPELIAQMLDKWREGFAVVYAVRAARLTDSFLKRVSAQRFYSLINRISDFNIPSNTGDFRLMDQKVVEALRHLSERTRFMKGIFAMMGFRQTAVYYSRPLRSAGQSKFPFWRLWNFALEGITSFSSTPLRIWSYIGGIVAIIGMAYGFFIALRTMIYGQSVPGFATIVVLVTVLGGLQLLSIGVLGEYIARIFIETKRRPLYIIDRLNGFDQQTIALVKERVQEHAVIPKCQDEPEN